MNSTRRTFITSIAAASAAMLAKNAFAQTKVDEASGQAVALGYVHDTTKVDGKKYPKHNKSQQCNRLYSLAIQGYGSLGQLLPFRRQASQR